MKALLTFLALGCLWAQAATVPPFPTVSTNRPKVLTNTFRAVRFTPPPASYGVSYTNRLSLLETQRWVSGWVRMSGRPIAHDLSHNTNTGERVLEWPSVPGRWYAIEAAWGEVPIPTRTEERTLVTNWYPSTVFYAVATNGAWFNANRSRYSFHWNTSNCYVRVWEL